MHRILRPKLFECVGDWLSSSQIGGKPRCGVDSASHIVKSFIDLLFATKMSGVLVFIDIRAAFYSVLRPLLYETGGSEEGLAKLVLLLDLPESCIAPLLDTLRKASALEQSGLSSHAQALTASLYDGLWWQMRGHSSAAVPRRGFCPGTGIADLAFTIVFRLVLSNIHDRLRSLGIGIKMRCSDEPIFSSIYPGQLVELFDSTWVDDTVIMSAVSSPHEIMIIGSTIASTAITQLRRVGFTPNCKQGKSQVMPIIIGKDAGVVKHDIFVKRKSKLEVTDDFGNVSLIHVGLEYKHLGNHKDAKRSRAKEIGYRIAEASGANKELCRSVRKSHLEPHKHWLLATSLCVTRLAFDAHTESKWTDTQIAKMSSVYNGFARRSAAKDFFSADNRLTSNAALSICKALPFELHLRFVRLGYLVRLANHGPSFLLVALDVLSPQPFSFAKLIKTDLVWLFERRGKDYGMPDPRSSLPVAISWVSECQKRWKKLLYRSRVAVTSHFALVSFGEWWQDQRLKECDGRAFPSLAGAVPASAGEGKVLQCWCGYTCSTYAKLSLHSANKHGHRQQEYHYLNERGLCGGCMKMFHNKRRLLRHLGDQKDKKCLAILASNYSPSFHGTDKAKYGQGSASDAVHRAGPPRDDDRRPVEQCCGPLLTIGNVEAVAGPGSIAYKYVDPPVPPHSSAHLVESYCTLVVGTRAALLVTKDIFILNLCSGHRRAGDIIDLASRINFREGFCVWFISIDIVSGNAEHNLACESCVDRILGHLSARRIHGWIIGPPCETWTAVRFLLLEDRAGPRPLRSAKSPWGLENLSCREYAQLDIGNTIVRAALKLCIGSLGLGLSGLIEHPEEPNDIAYPSIWRLALVERLKAHPDAKCFGFRQGPLGQASPKPTRFITANLPRVEEYIGSFSSRHFRPAPIAVRTVEENGLFSTAKLKTYPARLNAAMLMSFIDRFIKNSSRSVDTNSVLDHAFSVLMERCVEVEVQAHLCPAFSDYIDAPFDNPEHPLASLAEGPDRDAGIGRDFAF